MQKENEACGEQRTAGKERRGGKGGEELLAQRSGREAHGGAGFGREGRAEGDTETETEGRQLGETGWRWASTSERDGWGHTQGEGGTRDREGGREGGREKVGRRMASGSDSELASALAQP
mmetsp:Transcript_29037/g.69388  ORF Transcript_29037/g.69388 Transcript_29037/m.69388 type:complete len:120 (+) Transcript_29037:223-582(+)